MRREIVKSFAATLVMLSVAGVAVADIKVMTRYTYGDGKPSELTTYFKGVRQREEFKATGVDGKSYDVAHIYQCDLKRFLWVDYLNRRYYDMPYKSMEEAWAEYYEKQQAAKGRAAGAAPYRGVWTETTTITDTGERREMFGYMARRIKTLTLSEAAPQSCDQTKLRQETDGWYIDLMYGTECSSDLSGYLHVSFLVPGGYNSCSKFYEKRNYRFERKQLGAARFGFPVALTIRSYSNDGRNVSETRREVTEIKRVELDQSLFELPDGYAKFEPKPYKRSILERALSLFR